MNLLRRKPRPTWFNRHDEIGPNYKAMMTSEFNCLRLEALERLRTLGYFDEDAKELQCFNVEIRNPKKVDVLSNPHLPDQFTYQVTTILHPTPQFIITRNYRIRGKRFNHSKCLEPFAACGANGMIFGRRGIGVHPEQFREILNKLKNWDILPVKRPSK